MLFDEPAAGRRSPPKRSRRSRAGEEGAGRLLAISDLHLRYPENKELLSYLRPDSPEDWLIVAGDVAESVADVVSALGVLRERFAQVIWTPGNHELWTTRDDNIQLRGEERYRALVARCQTLGVITPEDDYPVWTGGVDGPVTVAPLFVLYDYSFRPEGAMTKDESLAVAYESGAVCLDEVLLHPDPHGSREAWCSARLKETERRLSQVDRSIPTVLVNHYPLIREPTRLLRYPEFAQWCGTEHTSDWHRRFGAVAVVYGHLHIRRTSWHDGVRFMEVSMGYPRDQAKISSSNLLCQVLPMKV